MKTKITRFRPSATQEDFIIKCAAEYAQQRSRSVTNPTQTLARILTEQCNYHQNLFDVYFRALYNTIKVEMSFNSIEQQQKFTIESLHLFLCRVIGTTPSFRREPAHKHRRNLFDKYVENKQGPQTTPINNISTNIVSSTNVKSTTPVKDQIFNNLVSTHPNLVALFISNRKQEFIEFCLKQ